MLPYRTGPWSNSNIEVVTHELLYRRWFISSRGYANVTASEGDIVYGAMFELSQEDEARLDRYEGVPNSYVKRIIPVRYLGDEDYGVDQENGHKMVDALVYVDILRPQEGPPKQEYIRRMNCGIRDGIEAGIPKGYITKYIRPFIPKADARPRSTQ